MGFLLGLILSIMGSSFIGAIIQLIISKFMDLKFMYFRFLFWDISSVNDEIKLTTRPFMPICQCMMVKPGMTDKEDKLNVIITNTINITLSGAVFFIVFANRPESYSLYKETLYFFLLGFSIGLLANAIFKLLYAIYFILTKDKRLFNYNKQIVQNWVKGHPLESLNIPPLENLKVKASSSEKLNYQSLRYMQRLYVNDYNSLASIVSWFESNLSEHVLKYEVGSYYNVLFYYSYVCLNYKKATYYYKQVYDELINDMDSNGRRVLAYYQFYVLKDPAQARATAVNGLNVIDKFSICGEERENEAKLLNSLINNIDSCMHLVP